MYASILAARGARRAGVREPRGVERRGRPPLRGLPAGCARAAQLAGSEGAHFGTSFVAKNFPASVMLREKNTTHLEVACAEPTSEVLRAVALDQGPVHLVRSHVHMFSVHVRMRICFDLTILLLKF